MPSLLEQEIASQPEIIARVLDRETKHVQQIVAALPPFNYVLIAARGTSDHAATYAKYIWPVLAGYPVALATPLLLAALWALDSRRYAWFVVAAVLAALTKEDVALLVDERADGGSRTARGHHVVHDQNPLARRHGVLVDVENVVSILERVLDAARPPRQLALLPDRHEPGVK